MTACLRTSILTDRFQHAQNEPLLLACMRMIRRATTCACIRKTSSAWNVCETLRARESILKPLRIQLIPCTDYEVIMNQQLWTQEFWNLYEHSEVIRNSFWTDVRAGLVLNTDIAHLMLVQRFAPTSHYVTQHLPRRSSCWRQHRRTNIQWACSLHWNYTSRPQRSSCQVFHHSFPKMTNEKLMSTFRLVFHKTSQFRIVPFAYHPKTNPWSIRTSKPGLLVSVLSTAILCFRLTFVVIALLSSDLNPENLHEDCLLALQLIVFFIGCLEMSACTGISKMPARTDQPERLGCMCRPGQAGPSKWTGTGSRSWLKFKVPVGL